MLVVAAETLKTQENHINKRRKRWQEEASQEASQAMKNFQLRTFILLCLEKNRRL